MRKVTNGLRVVAFGLLVLAAAGCATRNDMGLKRDSTTVDVSANSLLLMSAQLVNGIKPDYQPNAFVVYVEKPDAKEAADRLNFVVDNDGRKLAADGNQFLLRMSLPPGKYILRGIGGFSGSFPVRGNFLVPLHADIDVAPQSVIYLGKVSARMRERNGNEFRAGAPVPLIDQAVTGYGSGTWDIEIVDGSGEDIAALRRVFPALQKVEVQKVILPAWDRAKAQDWWDKH